jgi:pyruvate dehydrogenase E2 component (dihydrolipoamide acetyltransferase)
MPKQGQSVESCIISQWFKRKGDSVKVGEPLFSYETDKASFEEEAKADGILLEIFYGEGDEVPVLYNVAVIGQAGESVGEFRSGGSVTPAPDAPVVVPVVVETPVVQSAAAPPPPPTPAVVSSDAKIRVSPRARLIAEKLGINLATIQGTGPNGRIISRDVENANPTPALPTGERAGAPEIPASPASVEYSDLECNVKKLTNIRKLIAKAMHESLQNSAQLTHHMSADVRKLLALREEVKKAQSTDPDCPNITLNDMICRAVICALEKFPEVNSHFLGDSIKTFKKVHLGLAVDTPRGLMVPILKNACELSLKGLSNNLRALADNCRKGNIDPDLLQSAAGSFTVSNLGAYGVEMFTPIINLPQVAILGVNTIIQRPAGIGGGIMAFVPYIGLSLTYDHRAIDGGPATLFLKEIKTQFEDFRY